MLMERGKVLERGWYLCVSVELLFPQMNTIFSTDGHRYIC